MSLVFINNSTDTFTPTESGAIATFLWECCRAAAVEGMTPVVITRSAKTDPYGWKRTILLEYPRIPTSRPGIALCRIERRLDGSRNLRQRAFANRVANAIRRERLQAMPLLLNNDPEMAVFLRRCFPSARILHHFHNQLECKPRYRDAFGKAGIMVTAVSNYTSRWVENYYGLPRDSVKTIYNGVDGTRFHPAPVHPDGLPVITFVGRTGIEKAPDLLLKAAGKLSQRTRKFKVQIVGSNHWGRLEMDDYQRQLETLSGELETQGIRVDRKGHLDRFALPEAFRNGHIHVVPSRWDEPFGLTTIEGMASGLAVVGSRTGGTPEVIGDAGFLFERESVEGLTDCLERLVTDEQSRLHYGSRARARAESFTWKRTWKQLRAEACL